ncbi:hypothetical protein GGQ84_001334 [Desulfitispora alkaliphila]|uniref:YheC/YheD family endospore coat-associated protein n=1 Tax=Desulfitispora alkaliphila TaxID=622674 RepID=UPI003D1FC239
MKEVNSKARINSPVIGVLVRKSKIIKFKNQAPDITLERLNRANKEVKTTLYFFSIQDVDLQKKKISGVYYDESKKLWVNKKFPYPDIVYRRGYVAKPKWGILYEFEKQQKKLNIPTLNYKYGFNKWHVYQNLKQHSQFLPHLPHTVLYNTPDDLKNMFNISKKLYLKACSGGRGRQVMRALQLPDGGYQVSYFTDGLYTYKSKSFHGLLQKIHTFFAGRKFIVQNAIDLITVNNSIVDMRAEVQRDGNGEITIAAIPIRLSNENSPITAHASSYTFEHFFENFMQYSKEEILTLKDRVNNFLKLAYECIEKSYGPSGEIGIDIGMDKNSHLWFIECNSRSLKVSMFNAYDESTIGNSFRNLLEYAEFLHSNKQR